MAVPNPIDGRITIVRRANAGSAGTSTAARRSDCPRARRSAAWERSAHPRPRHRSTKWEARRERRDAASRSRADVKEGAQGRRRPLVESCGVKVVEKSDREVAGGI
jgi:hypothetical protein